MGTGKGPTDEVASDPEPVLAERAPSATTGFAAASARPATAPGYVLGLQRAAGNRAVSRWLSGPRMLARSPTIADQVLAAADRAEWKKVGGLLAGLPMAKLLDTAAALEVTGKLTWIMIHVDAAGKPARERIFAAIAAVQHASVDQQMEHRLALSHADERALDAWLGAHPDPTPPPEPTVDPITRADGTVFEPPTTASTDRDWARALLRFFHFAVDPTRPSQADACTIDGQPSTVGDVGLFVAEQGVLRGQHLIDPVDGARYVNEYFGESQGALGLAHDLEAKLTARDLVQLLDAVAAVPMPKLLAALEDVRTDGKLDDLAAALGSASPPARINAALLSVGGHIGVRWVAATKDLPEADAKPVREFLSARVFAHDVVAPAPLVHIHDDELKGRPFLVAPDTADDAWIDAFLHFFRLMNVPYDDDTFWFNETEHPLDEIIDITVEQGALDGRQLDPVRVKSLIGTRRETFKTRAEPEHHQVVAQYTIVPYTTHHPLGSSDPNTHDNPAHQLAAQYTIKFKNVGAWWSEIDVSALVQASFFNDPGSGDKPILHPDSLKLQSLVAGAQAAWAIPLFTDRIQLQAVVQGVIGASRDYSSDASGKVSIRPIFQGGPMMGQVAAQLQVVIQPFKEGTFKALQFFIGTQGSVTRVSDITTLDGTPVQLGVQWNFNLPWGI
jgi:hypothetical protein